jgi:hypothetical protein
MTNDDFELLKKRLPWLPEVPQQVRYDYYCDTLIQIVDASTAHQLSDSSDQFLENFVAKVMEMAVSSAGIHIIVSELQDVADGNQISIMMNFCKSCHKDLFEDVSSANLTPPKFSLANGWALGNVPEELSCLTQAETRMITKAPVAGVIHLIGRCASRGILRTHMMAYNALPRPAAMQVCDIK